MAHILRGYGLAREGSYFKTEQEAELQRHRQKLVKEGKLPSEPEGSGSSSSSSSAPGTGVRQRAQSLEESAHTYEVLSEIMAAQARVDDPEAARRQQYERRIKGEAPPLSQADMLRYRAASVGAGGSMYTIGAAVGHVPRMHLGRNRYQVPKAAEGLEDWTLGPRQLSPEAKEAARRAFLASLRSLVYGSVLGVFGLVAGGTLAVHLLDIRSPEDLRHRVQAGFQPLSATIRSWLLPLRTRAERWAGGGGEGGEGGAGSGRVRSEGLLAGSEFQRRLKDRYTPYPGRKAAGSGTAE